MAAVVPRAAPALRREVERSDPHRWTALAVLCVALLLIMLDNTVLNVALPTLVRELGATSTELQWIVDAYALVFGGLLLVGGSLADRLGRKRTFVAGLVLFAAGSTWSAFSPTVASLVAARAGMGVGAALIMPSTLAIITDMFRDHDERQRAIAAWAGMSGLGIAIGPIAGGLLLEHFAWGSVFLINLPVAAAGVALALPLVPDSRDPAPRRLDPAGALLSTTGLGLLLWAIIEAPSSGWTSPMVLLVGGLGLAVVAGFVAWERAGDHPMLPLDFFREPRFAVATSMTGLTMFALFGAMFALTQFLQFGLGFTPIEAGVRILPAAATLLVAAPVSARLVGLAGVKVTVAAGLLVIAAGLWMLSGTTTASTYTDSVTGMVLLGLGAGLVMPSAAGSVMGTLPRGRTGVGSATNGVSIQVGGALGVAVIGSLMITRYQDRMTSGLAPYPLPQSVRETVLGSVGAALEAASRVGGAAGAGLRAMARDAFVSGMDIGLLVGACAVLVSALVTVLALPGRPREEPPDG